MSSISKPVLVAGAASAVGDVIECSGIAHLQLFIKATVSAATLVGDVTFATSPDGSGDLSLAANAPAILVASNVVKVTADSAAMQLDVTAAKVTFASPAIGTSLLAIRLSNPPQFVVPRFTYTSGGGTVQIVVYAYGFSTIAR